MTSPILRRMGVAIAALALAVQACSLSLFQNPFNGAAATAAPTSVPLPAAQATFVVVLPEPLAANETLSLVILDEVTGLDLNETQYPMSPRDTLTYTATLTLTDHSIVKYRYLRSGATQTLEDSSAGDAIRYRMARVDGAMEINDILADWSDKHYARPTGSILGRVLDVQSGAALPNMLVSVGGVQAITDSMGRFELTHLPVGAHHLLAYSLDGSYQSLQQVALVAENNETPVELRLQPAPLVQVTFIASAPSSTTPGAPLRIAGNLLQFGNAFANLQGGVSVSADRMPVMSLQADGRYAATLSLPAGAYLQYKYTLGDGFWNAEHERDGGWALREFFVPSQDAVVEDAIVTWAAGDSAPILFEANVPAYTPPGDIIYIQFNAFGWMEPLPMWPLGNNAWAYKLYSPLNMLGSFHYRYCRNGQCGAADDAETAGAAASGRKVITSFTAQDLKDVVSAWAWYDQPSDVTIVGATVNSRAGGFMAGVEFQPNYRPNWSYFAPQALVNTQALGANAVILTPTWTYKNSSPLNFSVEPGQDPLWTDTAMMISQARALGLNAALFPAPNFPSTAEDFWQTAPQDAQWQEAWFKTYRAFAVNYADLAAQSGAYALILGGEWVAPALPGGAASNLSGDVEAQWASIISDVRARFKGQVWWALPYSKASVGAPLNFLQNVDGIYLLWSAPLAADSTSTKVDYANAAGVILDNEISPLVSLLKKPLTLAVSYPSASGAASGSVNLASANLNLQTQADIYEALLTAVNERAWVSGFVSRGYYLPAALRDTSASVRGKPAADLLWYWFPRLTGAAH
ncbi:MAG: hypothetical protein Fur002_00280 [Anaerolineales bacterium]